MLSIHWDALVEKNLDLITFKLRRINPKVIRAKTKKQYSTVCTTLFFKVGMRYAEYSLGCTGRKKSRFNYFKTQKSLEQKLKNSTVQHYFLTPAFFINQTQLGT